MLIYHDHLLIVEVKAGAFTYTSPATDLTAHIASLQNLVRNPVVQGKRFLKYLESAPNVPISDDIHDRYLSSGLKGWTQSPRCFVRDGSRRKTEAVAAIPWGE